ncbi:MAG: hypothetical protein NTW87_30820 [Planctomycetota bacterium]|nr:hypothetical protein [Planctomycetota bacterium]
MIDPNTITKGRYTATYKGSSKDLALYKNGVWIVEVYKEAGCLKVHTMFPENPSPIIADVPLADFIGSQDWTFLDRLADKPSRPVRQ